VADIMSTEESIQNAVTALKEMGAKVAFCVTISTNQMGTVESFLEKEGVPYATLTDLSAIIAVANMKRLINQREREEMEEWLKDPEGWAKKREDTIQKRKLEQAARIAGRLLEIKAVSLNAKDPFTYVSGIRSPIYTDNRVLISYPEAWKDVMDASADTIVEEIGMQNVDIIAGTATAGIPHAAYLAERLGMPLIYVNSKKDAEGKKTFEVEGVVPKGAKVLLMEDLISTGGSVLGSVDAVRLAGGEVNDIIAIFTYQMGASLQKFEENKVNVYSLSNISVLLDVAAEKNIIADEEKNAVIEWTKDTKGWGKKMGFE